MSDENRDSRKIHEVELSKIKVGDRHRRDAGDIFNLQLTIERKGLLHPIILEPRLDGNFNLVAGFRRFTAFQNLRRKTIPAILKEFLSDIDKQEVELEENLKRKQLTYAEEAKAIQTLDRLKKEKYSGALQGFFGRGAWSQRDTAKELGISEAKVSQDIKLAEMLEDHPEVGRETTRRDAMRLIRKIESGVDINRAPSELAQKVREKFVHMSVINSLKSIDDNCVDCLILDLHDQGYNEILQEAYRVTTYVANCFAFYEFSNYEVLIQGLKDQGFNLDPKPLMWHMKSKDDYLPFIWFSKGMGKFHRNINRHNSYNPDSDAVHSLAKPYGLFLSLLDRISKPDQYIVETASYGLGLVKFGMDRRRNVQSYCPIRSVYERCLMNLSD